MKEETYTKQKIAAFMKAHQDMISESKLTSGFDGIDYINNLLTFRLEAFIYKSAQPTQTITHVVKRPTFFEWIFRRERFINITVECDKVFKVAPDDKALLTYNIKPT